MERCRERLVIWLRRLLFANKVLDERKRRRIFLIAVANMAAILFVLFFIFIRLLTSQSWHNEANQEHFTTLFSILLVLITSFYLLSKGWSNLAAVIILFLMLFSCLHGSWIWGIDLYTINAIYPVLILLSALLLGRRFAFLFLSLIASCVTAIYFAHQSGVVEVSHDWRTSSPSIYNLFTIILTYVFITFLFWLTVRELENALIRTQQLNFSLRKAQIHLEKKVKERTQSLEKLQLEQLLSVSSFVELGKLSAGLLHDLRQPLSVLHLLADRYKEADFNQALAEITTLLSLNQRQTNCSMNFELFSLQQEIAGVVSLFKFKIDDCAVSIVVQNTTDLDLYADRAVFHKVLANLLMNAIESLSDGSKERIILISWQRNRLGLKLFVKDFGVGISQESQALIFTPRFSSKGSLGLGLYLSNQSMKEVYGTAITFISELNKGSVFIMQIKNKFIYE